MPLQCHPWPAKAALYSSDALERGYERLVGKDEVLPYREGPMLSWLKVKVPHYLEGERGWEPQKT